MTISDWMSLRGITQIELAVKMEMTTQALRNKLKLKDSPGFFIGEVQDMKAALGISMPECLEAIENEANNAKK